MVAKKYLTPEAQLEAQRKWRRESASRIRAKNRQGAGIAQLILWVLQHLHHDKLPSNAKVPKGGKALFNQAKKDEKWFFDKMVPKLPVQVLGEAPEPPTVRAHSSSEEPQTQLLDDVLAEFRRKDDDSGAIGGGGGGGGMDNA